MVFLFIDGVACMPKTPAAWSSLVQSILNTEEATTSSDPFRMFLHLLVIASQYWINNGAAAKVLNEVLFTQKSRQKVIKKVETSTVR